jgi:hypothetical protein
MIRLLPIAAVLLSVAPAARAQAQAPFSCDPAFESRVHSGIIDREMRDWIADTARRFAKPRAALFWQHLPRELYPCADLSCLSDDQLVAAVARQCTARPNETLDQAAQDISRFPQHLPRPAPVQEGTITGPYRPQ